PGTENVPGIVGFGAAARLALEGMATDVPRMQQLRDRLFAALSAVDGVTVNGHPTERLCNNVNVNIAGARAEIMLHALEERGVLVSSGSACHAGQTGPSHVLKAIGLTEKDTGSLRITLSRHTTAQDVETATAALIQVIDMARKAGI
ncbi:MAG: cysteine desulfurase, partial [Myxococcota bacterium]